MKSIFNVIVIVLLVIIVSDLAYLTYQSKNQVKIGVVQLSDLVYEYHGMKEATEIYTNKLNEWGAISDSLENVLNLLVNDMQLDSLNGDQEKLFVDQRKFVLNQQKFYDFQKQISEKAQRNDEEMTIGVMNQITKHIEEYSNLHSFDLIVANTQLGNVGFAKNSMDVTKEILEYANNKYDGHE